MGEQNEQQLPTGPDQKPRETTPKNDLAEYEKIFASKKEGVLRTLRAASRTPNGTRYKEVKDDLTFEDFLKIPNVVPEQLSKDIVGFRVPGEAVGGFTVQTSGSSGVKKEVRFSKEGMIAQIKPEVLEQINNSERPILLIDEGSVDSTSHSVLKRSFEALATKRVETEGFTYPDEALDAILRTDSDLIYTYLNPTLVNLFLDGLVKLKEAGDPRISQLRGRKFFIESGGDAMSIGQLRDWDKKLTELFGPQKDRIHAFYGQSEQLLVGSYYYQPGDSEIRYKIRDKKLCLVLDENGKPVIGKKGRLEITNLLESSEPTEGITVLPRYLTGDLATLNVEDGEYYLTNIERDPERASFSVTGEKIFLNMIPTELEKVGLSDTKFEFQELRSGDRKVLRIVVIPRFNQGSDVNLYARKISEIFLTQYPALMIPIGTGLLKINVELGSGDFEKRWKLLPKAEISAEEWDKIESTVKPSPNL